MSRNDYLHACLLHLGIFFRAVTSTRGLHPREAPYEEAPLLGAWGLLNDSLNPATDLAFPSKFKLYELIVFGHKLQAGASLKSAWLHCLCLLHDSVSGTNRKLFEIRLPRLDPFAVALPFLKLLHCLLQELPVMLAHFVGGNPRNRNEEVTPKLHIRLVTRTGQEQILSFVGAFQRHSPRKFLGRHGLLGLLRLHGLLGLNSTFAFACASPLPCIACDRYDWHGCEQMSWFVCYLRSLCLSWLLLGFFFLGFVGFLGFFFGGFLLNLIFGDLVAVAVCFSRPPRRRGFGLS